MTTTDLLSNFYIQKYQNLAQQVERALHLAGSRILAIDTWDIDIEIALLLLKEASDFNYIKQVLSHSPELKDCKASIYTNKDYPKQVSEYISNIYNWAKELQKYREKKLQSV